MLSVSLRPLIVVVSTVMTLFFATGCPGSGPVYPKCENDDQCKKDKDGAGINEYCLFGECQQCSKDAHCAEGETCNRGRCEVACGSDAQCGDGKICESSSCVPAQCSDAAPCGAKQRCDSGRCVTAGGTSSSSTQSNGSSKIVCNTSETVSFDFNTSDLRPDAREALDRFAKCMLQNGSWRVTVAGHADERGTTEYNLQLGDRRAGAVRDYLSRLGVERTRIKTISYGEERPVDSSNTEDAWARNRRGELTVQE